MEKGASGIEPLQHGLVGCFMFVLQKSVENRNVGPPNSHTDDPELHELRRSYLESSIHEYDVNGCDVDAVQNKVSSKDEDSFTHR